MPTTTTTRALLCCPGKTPLQSALSTKGWGQLTCLVQWSLTHTNTCQERSGAISPPALATSPKNLVALPPRPALCYLGKVYVIPIPVPAPPPSAAAERGGASSPPLLDCERRAFLPQPPHHKAEEGQGQLSCTHATRSSSPRLPRQGEEPALHSVMSREGWDQLSIVFKLQHGLRWQPGPGTFTWSLVVT